jgi:hypothetical protein
LYPVEIDSDVMIYIPNFIKIVIGILWNGVHSAS